MSILSDRDLRREVLARGIVRSFGGQPDPVQPASVDVVLCGDPEALIGYGQAPNRPEPPMFVIDPENPPVMVSRHWEEHPDYGRHYMLWPGEFLLGCTEESVVLPVDLAAQYDGRSSLGRLGLLSHCTAGWIDPGYRGRITVELKNVAPYPIVLRPRMPLGQIIFTRLTSPSERPYGHGSRSSRYQDSYDTVQSRRIDLSGTDFVLNGDDGHTMHHPV